MNKHKHNNATKHTPTPWTVATYSDFYPTVEGPGGAICPEVSTNANAEHIVLCVNAHYDLLAAAKTFKAWLDHEDSLPEYTDTGGRHTAEGQKVWWTWYNTGRDLCAASETLAAAAIAKATGKEVT